MEYIAEGIGKAVGLILSADREVFSIVLLSLRVSGTSLIFASAVGVPFGFVLATYKFRGRRFLTVILNTLMALPTVVVGLTVYALISRQGPLGVLGLLYTPKAMILGQFVLATPIVSALTLSAVENVDPRVKETALTLGAGRVQSGLAVLKEARFAVMAAVAAGFGRVIAEVGSAMMLGGNIRGATRTMTTAIALETAKGEFGLGIALGVVLLIVAFSVNIVFNYWQRRGG